MKGKAKYYISVVALVVGVLGLFTGQMLAQPVANYAVGGTNYYIEVEEPFVVTATPPRGEFYLFPGEEATITFKISNKNNELDYSAVFVYWVESSGMLFAKDVTVEWSGVDGSTKLAGMGEVEYPWVLVKSSSERGLPGPERTVTVKITLAPTAPSGLYTMHFVIKRTGALVKLTWSDDALLYNSTILPCVINNSIILGMPPAFRDRAICIVREGAICLASKTDSVVNVTDFRVIFVEYASGMGLDCATASYLEQGIIPGKTGGVNCLEGTGIDPMDCDEILAYIGTNKALVDDCIAKATAKCP